MRRGLLRYYFTFKYHEKIDMISLCLQISSWFVVFELYFGLFDGIMSLFGSLGRFLV
jgi:hypothetical protein